MPRLRSSSRRRTARSRVGTDGAPEHERQPAITTPDAIYKGLALATTTHGSFLYATNFHSGTVDVFDSDFVRVHKPGPSPIPMPHCYAPFNVQQRTVRFT